jgi:hypothetical protein
MGIRGAKPKPDGQRVSRYRQVYQWTEVDNVPFEGAPKLPRRSLGRRWPPRTLEKWKALSTMPHCVLWRPSDWEFAFTAMELAAYYHEGQATMARELRAWEKVLATTAADRRDQRIRYVDPKPDLQLAEGAGAEVFGLEDYRDL